MDTKKFPLSPSIFLYVSNHSDHTHSYEGRTEGQAKTRERDLDREEMEARTTDRGCRTKKIK